MNERQFKLLFDGECPFCRLEIRWLPRWNRRGHLEFEDIVQLMHSTLGRTGDLLRNVITAILLVYAAGASAQDVACTVETTNHGGGLFTYTFKRGNLPYVWALGESESYTGGVISLQSYGVLDVQEPPGWMHTVSSSGLITWTVTDGPGFLDEPVEFSVLSCLTESKAYTYFDDGIVGYIAGVVVALPDRTDYLGGGYQVFDFTGPVLPRLRVLQQGANVSIHWSAEAQGLQLEESARTDIPEAWSPVTNLPSIIDLEYVVTLPATNSQRFFRLVAPCAR